MVDDVEAWTCNLLQQIYLDRNSAFDLFLSSVHQIVSLRLPVLPTCHSYLNIRSSAHACPRKPLLSPHFNNPKNLIITSHQHTIEQKHTLMSNLAVWFKKHEQLCPSVETQLFKDFIDGKINPRFAEILMTRNIEMKEKPNGPLYDIVETVVSLGVQSSIKPFKIRSSSPHQRYELSESIR